MCSFPSFFLFPSFFPSFFPYRGISVLFLYFLAHPPWSHSKRRLCFVFISIIPPILLYLYLASSLFLSSSSSFFRPTYLLHSSYFASSSSSSSSSVIIFLFVRCLLPHPHPLHAPLYPLPPEATRNSGRAFAGRTRSFREPNARRHGRRVGQGRG